MENELNDRLEIEGDRREECQGGGETITDGGSHCDSFEKNLQTPEEKAEYEAWLDAGLPKGWENAPLSAQIAFLVAGDNPEEFDALKSELKGE